MTVTLADARAAQEALFTPRPEADLRWIPTLLAEEHAQPDEADARQATRLGRMLRFAARAVPFYAAWAEANGLRVSALTAADLDRVPILHKATVAADPSRFHAATLPPGDVMLGVLRTSGTTGRPLEIRRSVRVAEWFTRHKCREVRWQGLDLRGTLLSIRPFTELPIDASGRHVGEGEVYEAPRWPLVGRWFTTGPFFAARNTNPIAALLQLTRRLQPSHLITQVATLEHLALSADGPLPGLQAALALSQTMTPALHAAVTARLGVPVHQNYGLNEIGLVASRCPEGGRYHVHTEAAHVELLDADGAPAAPGTEGRIVVTSLINTAMPLLRYDTGDLARVPDGPCPCGRTLPGFGAVAGRYRRVACLPDGTWARWGAVQHALWALPDALHAGVRQYQVHHHRDGAFTLRLVGDPALADAVRDHVLRFLDALPGPAHPLTVAPDADLFADTRGKFQAFTSDFYDDLPPEGV